ncbi:hypothetical protein EJ03DRAFT_384100 [Teratosphaeria nubilosa]|uniref:Uncharacterized protein n=1 Tax=Teratosphaeria nubilosa TaxID=161662 RepID=A0A6G1L362_9PEZI|nr:hypothetical protein EJ03DRAFT_384100 [Teratosphaeria nubilosa]
MQQWTAKQAVLNIYTVTTQHHFTHLYDTTPHFLHSTLAHVGHSRLFGDQTLAVLYLSAAGFSLYKTISTHSLRQFPGQSVGVSLAVLDMMFIRVISPPLQAGPVTAPCTTTITAAAGFATLGQTRIVHTHLYPSIATGFTVTRYRPSVGGLPLVDLFLQMSVVEVVMHYCCYRCRQLRQSVSFRRICPSSADDPHAMDAIVVVASFLVANKQGLFTGPATAILVHMG